MSEYTERIDKIEASMKWVGMGNQASTDVIKLRQALGDIFDVLREMSDDIESLRNRSHSHDGSYC